MPSEKTDVEPEDGLPPGMTRNPDGTVNLPTITCPKCGDRGVMFICSIPGCPVNGGAAYG